MTDIKLKKIDGLTWVNMVELKKFLVEKRSVHELGSFVYCAYTEILNHLLDTQVKFMEGNGE